MKLLSAHLITALFAPLLSTAHGEQTQLRGHQDVQDRLAPMAKEDHTYLRGLKGMFLVGQGLGAGQSCPPNGDKPPGRVDNDCKCDLLGAPVECGCQKVHYDSQCHATCDGWNERTCTSKPWM